MSAYVVLVTFPDRERAVTTARTLIEEQLAACVNVIGDVRSIYRWEGKVHDEGEALCVIKTARESFERLRARVVALHPYDVPEVIAMGIDEAHGPYLEWLVGQVKSDEP